MTDRLLLLDGHSLAYRAFFALPVENFSTTTGQPTLSADAASWPKQPNPNGKLLAPNTATGPTGTFQRESRAPSGRVSVDRRR